MWNEKRAFEMVNTTACLYDYENNPAERENLRIQKDRKIEWWLWEGEREWNVEYNEGSYLYLKLKYFNFNREKGCKYREEAGKLANFIIGKWDYSTFINASFPTHFPAITVYNQSYWSFKNSWKLVPHFNLHVYHFREVETFPCLSVILDF